MTDPVPDGLVRVARLCALAGGGLGLLGLVGWALDARIMTTFVAGRPPMMPNTALALAALGMSAAIDSARQPPRVAKTAMTGGLAFVALAIGAATILEYALGYGLGIDSLLMATDDGAPYPGRPSPMTAAAVSCLALSLLVAHGHGRLAHSAQGLTLAAAFLAFVSVVGHLYGAGEMYQLRSTTVIGVALPTAIALLLISSGMLLRHPRVGVMRLATSRSSGGVLVRRLGLVAILGMPALGVLAYHLVRQAGVQDLPLTLAVLTVVGVPLAVALIVVTAGRLDRVHTELEASRARARLLVEESADAVFVADLAGRYTDVNAAGCRLLGLTKEEIVGRTILDFIPQDEVSLLAAAKEQLAGGLAQTAEWHLRRRDGSYMPVEVSAKFLPDGRWQGIVRDITRRKAAEEAARRSEARLDGIISLAADAIISIDEGQRILMYNEGAERIFGWKRAEVIGQPIDVLMPGRLVDRHRRHVQQFGAEAVSARMMQGRPAVTGIRRNGEEFPAEAAISKLRQDGQTLYTVFLRDMTATRRLEEDLRRNVERFRLLADAGEALHAPLDAGDVLVRVAELAVKTMARCCAIVRVEPSGPTVVRCAEGTAEADLATLLLPLLTSREPVLIPDVSQERLRLPGPRAPDVSGPIEPLRSSLITVPILAGERLAGGMLLLSGANRQYGAADVQMAMDLGRRIGLALENERLYQAAHSAMRARDEMLSIVAHDLRSPLAAVGLGADLLARQVPDDRREATKRTLDAIRRSVRRATRLVDDLLDVARIDEGRLEIVPRELSPEAVVAGAVESFAAIAAEARVALETDVAADLPPVLADEDRVHQILANLVDNAIAFTPAGGCVRIVVRPDASAVRFAVVDTGPGIPPEHVPHLFDRFWQARSSRRGAGLGLAIVKGIVEAHGGRIWVESTPGRGSTFAFTLPCP